MVLAIDVFDANKIPTAAEAEVWAMIEKRGLEKKFPLFTAIHRAVTKEITPEGVFKCIGLVSAA